MVRALACCAAVALVVGVAPPVRQVAITFDDLPGASISHSEVEFFERVNRELVASLKANAIPAIGFVNEGKLAFSGDVEPARVALLKQWVDAGFELGNHTYSHADLHTTPLDEFTRDTLRGEKVTRQLLAAAGRSPRFFRHPYLHTGRDAATRAGFDAFLRKQGYRVAPVTIDNYDYLFARAYDRAGDARDASLQRRVADEYVGYMTRVVEYYERQAHAIVGRVIPQILLVHVSALNAHAFDRLAAMLKGRGYEFIPIERALEDSAYQSRDEYYGPGGITWLHRWALTAGKRGAFFAGEPVVPDWITKAGQ
jgi:peptidoglycan/xylan/chitin deacetylase (PgdA/CDA1 family)